MRKVIISLIFCFTFAGHQAFAATTFSFFGEADFGSREIAAQFGFFDGQTIASWRAQLIFDDDRRSNPAIMTSFSNTYFQYENFTLTFENNRSLMYTGDNTVFNSSVSNVVLKQLRGGLRVFAGENRILPGGAIIDSIFIAGEGESGSPSFFDFRNSANNFGGITFTSGHQIDFFNISVPEPSTWLMMIFGFGLSGLALKRRRHFAV
ncbi:PEPxxWA-CTERM sorting domain-containing protein [Kordiimonas sp. SCSIO 12610]|uniref:PEPxxWA-CTERM sorting domain-containing protein n=1 Tax=Kordiimonas sp. SCSIO 12610 TaxID=2829597 RepID=UPI00210DF60B|nr:PEPxxWA-CTERM sorting domain-containing protein [Kordiimonas sp. SCSIO 12610]UTW56071.1 PEP-CTERM sorting domain-containing protein [Kordiimonas sp. SCSIO 12610]